MKHLPLYARSNLRLHLCGSSRHIADAILAPHRTAVGDFDLEPLDFLGELDALRIGQRFALLVDVSDVQHLAHELNHRLRLVERGSRYCKAKNKSSYLFSISPAEKPFLTVNIKHHLPL